MKRFFFLIVFVPILIYAIKKGNIGGIIISGILVIVIGFVFVLNLIQEIKQIKKDKEHEKQLNRRIAKGDLDALIELGVLRSSQEKLNEAKCFFEKAVEKGHREAQSKLDECLRMIADKKARDKEIQDEINAREAARPRCSYCNEVLDVKRFSKYGVVVGSRNFCSRMCKINAGY